MSPLDERAAPCRPCAAGSPTRSSKGAEAVPPSGSSAFPPRRRGWCRAPSAASGGVSSWSVARPACWSGPEQATTVRSSSSSRPSSWRRASAWTSARRRGSSPGDLRVPSAGYVAYAGGAHLLARAHHGGHHQLRGRSRGVLLYAPLVVPLAPAGVAVFLTPRVRDRPPRPGGRGRRPRGPRARGPRGAPRPGGAPRRRGSSRDFREHPTKFLQTCQRLSVRKRKTSLPLP